MANEKKHSPTRCNKRKNADSNSPTSHASIKINTAAVISITTSLPNLLRYGWLKRVGLSPMNLPINSGPMNNSTSTFFPSSFPTTRNKTERYFSPQLTLQHSPCCNG